MAKTAREMFLDCHRNKILSDYKVDGNISFDGTVENLQINETPAGKILFDYFNSDEGYEKTFHLVQKTKNELVKSLSNKEDPVLLFEKHMDYESLVLDKLVDYTILPISLATISKGRPFFIQMRMYHLMNQGYQLNENHNERHQWFSQWNNSWFLQNTLTKNRLLDILANYSDDWIANKIEKNKPEYKSLNQTYEQMTHLHRESLLNNGKAQQFLSDFKEKNPTLKNYAQIISDSTEYNEGLRLLRSHAFYQFANFAIENKKKPLDLFYSFLKKRTQKIEHAYRL